MADMTKQDLVNEISKNTGIEKYIVEKTIESLMETVRVSMAKNKNIYLRGFGTFLVKKRAKKTARNISKNKILIIPEHFVPTFKPSKKFLARVKTIKRIV
jgi:DNA-binding protein HU-beta